MPRRGEIGWRPDRRFCSSWRERRKDREKGRTQGRKESDGRHPPAHASTYSTYLDMYSTYIRAYVPREGRMYVAALIGSSSAFVSDSALCRRLAVQSARPPALARLREWSAATIQWVVRAQPAVWRSRLHVARWLSLSSSQQSAVSSQQSARAAWWVMRDSKSAGFSSRPLSLAEDRMACCWLPAMRRYLRFPLAPAIPVHLNTELVFSPPTPPSLRVTGISVCLLRIERQQVMYVCISKGPTRGV